MTLEPCEHVHGLKGPPGEGYKARSAHQDGGDADHLGRPASRSLFPGFGKENLREVGEKRRQNAQADSSHEPGEPRRDARGDLPPRGHVAARVDRPHTLFYLDPPYWGREADYGHDLFAAEDFERLADQFAGLRGRFVLSINDTPEVREFFAREEVAVTYSAGSRCGRNTRARELIVTGP